MKNKIISITALILAIALFILTGCNAEKEPEAETTTKESLSATITQAETTADSDKEETEVVSEIVTNDEGETEIITEIVTKSEEATTKKNSDKTENTTAKKNFTTKEIVEMFNTSANRIKTDASKVVKNFEKRIVNEDKTDIPSAMGSVAESMMASMMGDDTEPIPFTGKDEIIENLKGLDALLLEANHDVNMVQVGPYPYYLKQRILGKKGHLSNENAGRLLSAIVHDELKHVFLGHLSKENNHPELAHEAVRLEITMGDNPYQASDFDIRVADRNEPSGLIIV